MKTTNWMKTARTLALGVLIAFGLGLTMGQMARPAASSAKQAAIVAPRTQVADGTESHGNNPPPPKKG